MATSPADRTASMQIVATVAASGAVLVCAIAVLWEFVPAILWASVLVIALWPSYARLVRAPQSPSWLRAAGPLMVTVALGLFLALPFAFGATELERAARAVAHWTTRAQREGVPVPAAIEQLPYLGPAIASWWRDNLSDPQAAVDLVGQIGPGQLVGWSRIFGAKIAHSIITYVITLAAVFFLFRDGPALRARFATLSHRLFGERGELVALHVTDAIHGTVIGLVLVGLAEGAVIGVGYWLTGVPHAFLFAIATGILAIIPMGAPLAFCIAAVFLYIQGNVIGAVIVIGLGFLVVMLADYLVRPILIGGAARLPFLLVLLGTLGGLSTLGLIGLFVGPVLMAVLLALWRDFSAAEAPAPQMTQNVPNAAP
jgi:predicted PurR-regulated permease PerM